MAKVIVLTSGKGGVGKTTCAANIGIHLSKLNYKVLVIDADIGLRNLDMVLGFEEMISYNIIDVILGNIPAQSAIISHSGYPGFFLLPASAGTADTIITPTKMCGLVDSLRSEFDYILIDSPAGIENGFYSAVAPSDEAVVIVNPEVSSIRDADRTTEILRKYKDIKIHLIINRLNKKMIDSGEMVSVEDITDILGIDLLGIIPEDKNVVISSNKGLPIVETDSTASQALRNIACRLTGQVVRFSDLREKDSFFGRLTKKLMWG
ncbi:MAG: septum site-determining protein MinD [Eubacteriaceae bacterium]|nr:septum site-determining protein MinD [Eubacteriaceae bacterium]